MPEKDYTISRVSERSVFAPLGASNHADAARGENDYYATDPQALELLLDVEQFYPVVWECACGEGVLSQVLLDRGYAVCSTDLYDRGYGKYGVDFLQCTTESVRDTLGLERFDIITNPPYKYAQQFVEQAIKLIKDTQRVAMLLRLQFLEGRARRKMFEQYPPKIIYVSSGRIMCYKDGDFSSKEGSALAYAWYIWQKGWYGDPTIKWFN